MLRWQNNWSWRSQSINCLTLGSILAGLVLGVADARQLIPLWGSYANAQIVPDNTLGNEPSRLTNDVIAGGATRGANLFHSFSEFNIGEGQQVYFANPNGIQRILSRVTGTSRSEILGTLGVLGNADLFLINPNGILFGPNAQLDLRGAFIASTGNSLVFSNEDSFSTIDPRPPLLTVNVPVGLQIGSSPGDITIQGTAIALRSGRTLGLIGGNVTFAENAVVFNRPGRFEIGGLSDAGTLAISEINNQFFLQFPQGVPRADVSLFEDSQVGVLGIGGDLKVSARNITLNPGSLAIGITAATGTPGRQAGDLVLDATDTIRLSGEPTSSIFNASFPGSQGQPGNIRITAKTVSIADGGVISSDIRGVGNGGNISIQADSLVVSGEDSDGFVSSISSQVGRTGIGDGGKIQVSVRSLTLSGGAQITSNVFGRGNAGNIAIESREQILLDGSSRRGFASGFSSGVGSNSLGQGGSIDVTAPFLSLTNGASLDVRTLGQGNAGNLNVTAGTVLLSGQSDFTAATGGTGNAGAIALTIGDTLTLNQASAIRSNVLANARGDGSNINITTVALQVLGGSSLQTSTAGQGSAGKVAINARDAVVLDGSGNDSVLTGITSQVFPSAIGNGNSIDISTRELSILNRARIDASTRGQGEAGNINIVANQVDLAAGGQLRTITGGVSDAGNIIVMGSDRVTLRGSDSGLFANTEAGSTGKGGTIVLASHRLSLHDRAQISVDSQGSGEGGDIQIRADALTLDTNSAISAQTVSNTGGNLDLNVRDLLLLRQNSTISTTAGTARGNGNGGNIGINAGFIVAVPNENSDITANAFRGNGGNIAITTQGIFGIEFRDRQTPLSDITASSQFGVNGVVTVNTLGIDPVQGAVELPATFSTPPLARGCQARGSQTSSFVNTGRGGIPTNPTDPLMADTLWQDLELLGETEQGATEQPTTNPQQLRTDNSTSTLIEAQGWIVRRDGTVVLTAQPPTVTPNGIEGRGSPSCQPR